MPTYSGSCHCGAIRFEIDTEISDLYTCDCSLCAKKNALMTTVHESRFNLLAGEDKLSLYQWNTRIARHYFCSVCGIYPFHRKRSMPDHYGVNVRALDTFDPAGMPVRAAEGHTMSVVDANPRKEWSGPRE
ncbi:GFA family protein [Terricaulis sp.]|uniref:GFA family protein n=1 Tax=Terricaulis sp. TaxID=2768686 RepID=UPI002AC66498|nr:GFA family protein [Terricaulis sp.]MDZ4693077.1 GFA family protein [Terricaulis sp.]